jgi:hypothetical protein
MFFSPLDNRNSSQATAAGKGLKLPIVAAETIKLFGETVGSVLVLHKRINFNLNKIERRQFLRSLPMQVAPGISLSRRKIFERAAVRSTDRTGSSRKGFSKLVLVSHLSKGRRPHELGVAMKSRPFQRAPPTYEESDAKPCGANFRCSLPSPKPAIPLPVKNGNSD